MEEKDIVYKKLYAFEEYIEYYKDLIKAGYKASDIFERLTERMKTDKTFTATELVVALCIAYDVKIFPVVVREILKLSPLVYQKLAEMDLIIPITNKDQANLRRIVSLEELQREKRFNDTENCPICQSKVKAEKNGWYRCNNCGYHYRPNI